MAVNATDDSAVIREVLSGRTDAFRALVERYFATVRLVALAKTGNLADAEDVAQDTFIKAYETLGVLRNRERLAPWLVAITRNLAISLVRRRERERRKVEAYLSDPLVHPDHERRETLDAVARQVEALPENLREVVLLHYFEGLKCREIGDRLDMNTNAVVKRLTRGREMLGDRLLREWGESRAEATSSRVHQVMGAIVALPRPDWGAQLAGMGGASAALKSGGLAAVLLGPPLAFKVFTAVFIVVLGVLYVSLNPAGSGGDIPTASAGISTPAAEEGLVAAVASGVGKQWKQAISDEDDGPVTVAIEPITPVPTAEVGFVSGVVIDADGVPVRDAIVLAGGGQSTGKATSNPNGEFRINVDAPVPTIEEGEVSKHVTVSCSMPGYVPRVVLGVRLGTSDVRMVLMKPAAVSGTVQDAATGAPVAVFSLRIDGPRSIRNPDTGMFTNSTWQETRSPSGEFRIEGQYGAGKLDITAPGYVGNSVETLLSQGETVSGLVIALERGVSLTGVVYDDETKMPLAGAMVIVRQGTGPRESYGKGTSEDGVFAIDELSGNTAVVLEVRAQGYRRQFIEAATGASAPPVAIYLDRGTTLRGRVRYQGGPPPESLNERIEDGYCQVRIENLENQSGNGGAGRVNADGSYEVRGLEPGVYSAHAFRWPCGNGPECQSMYKVIEVHEDGPKVLDLDLDFDDEGGEIEAFIEGDTTDLEILAELSTPEAPETVLHRLETTLELPRTTWFEKLEPGEYLLRVYAPGGETPAIQESVHIVKGKTVELVIDASVFGDTTSDVTAVEGGEVAEEGDSAGE